MAEYEFPKLKDKVNGFNDNAKRDAALARNGQAQSNARRQATPTPKPKVDWTTQKLIDQAKARSQANAGLPPPSLDPQPSVTGEFTYNSTPIEQLIDDVYGQKTPDFLGDAKKDANRIYAPIMKDLDRQGKTARKDSKHNTKELKGMYGALQGGISFDATGIAKNTKDTISDTNLGTQRTVNSVGDNFSNANNEVAALMKSLGLEAAAGDVLPAGAEHQAFLQGIVQNEGQGSANLARQLGQNSLNFNTAQKHIAGFEGAQNVARNQKNLSDQLAQLATTRASVGSQRAGQASSLAAQLRGDYTNSLNSKANALVQSYAQQQQMDIARMNAQAGIEQARITAEGKAAGAGQPSAYQQYQMTDPGTRIYATAAQLFGTGGDGASRAVALANHVASNNASKIDATGHNTGDNRFPTAQRYAEAVVQANKAQPPELHLPPDKLLALAYSMWEQLNG